MTGRYGLRRSACPRLERNGAELLSTPCAPGGVEWCTPPMGVHHAPTRQFQGPHPVSWACNQARRSGTLVSARLQPVQAGGPAPDRVPDKLLSHPPGWKPGSNLLFVGGRESSVWSWSR